MAYPTKTPAVQFHVDMLTRGEVALRRAPRSVRLQDKAATFEAVLFAVSLKDKIDPQILLRIEAKLDRVLEHFDDTYEGGNDFRAQDDVAQPPRSRISRRDFRPESFRAPAA